jgi:diguanylate cyclase (GGDEF)-like protein
VQHVDGRALTLVALHRTESPTYVVLDGDWSGWGADLRRLTDGLFSPTDERPSTSRSGDAEGLARALASAGDVTEALDLLLQTTRNAVRCRCASVALPAADGALRIAASLGYPLAIMANLRLPVGQGLIGEVYRRAMPLLVRDTAHAGLTPRRPRFRTGACALVPIESGPQVVGVLAVADPESDAFSQEDVRALQALVAPAALALARLRVEHQAIELTRAAAVDHSTGLFNRAHFETRLREEVQRSSRHGMPLSVQVIDVDSFKDVNDRFGHMTGDEIVRGVADILKRSVRVFDVCARFGGDEFAILMPGSRLDGAAAIAERIRSRIAEQHPPLPPIPPVSVSIGVAQLRAGEVETALVERADRALYIAKRGGKNRVVADTPSAANTVSDG